MFSELLTLFISSFVAATLFPGGSELLLIYYTSTTPEQSLSYFVSATAGNSLGALLTYFIGYYLCWGRATAQRKHQRAWLFCQRYGVIALLLSWLPIVGDVLPLVAGWLKLAILPSILFIIVGKALRYGVVISSTRYLLAY